MGSTGIFDNEILQSQGKGWCQGGGDVSQKKENDSRIRGDAHGYQRIQERKWIQYGEV